MENRGAKMKIEVWSDFVCPFCYIGKRRLEQALNQFPHKEQVDIEFKSFELDPNSKTYSGKSIHEAIAKKYGISNEEAKKANSDIGQQAASIGLDFNFDEMKPTNTFDAHRLAKFAKSKGLEATITENLLYAYFTESKNVSDHDTLADIAKNSGLNRTEALNVLQDKQAFANDVRMDEAVAQQYGISGVPYFIINQKYAISGAQPHDTFVNALQKVWDEENATPILQDLSVEDSTDASCVDGNCAIPDPKQ